MGLGAVVVQLWCGSPVIGDVVVDAAVVESRGGVPLQEEKKRAHAISMEKTRKASKKRFMEELLFK